MRLAKATHADDWQDASRILLEASQHLERLGHPLWPKAQVSFETLARMYQLDELYFLVKDANRIGLVLLMQSDSEFWPEIATQDSLYFHKLALLPSCMSQGNGGLAIDAIIHEARRRKCNWVRLDCDDRPALHRFYRGCGFELVDIKFIAPYTVARYQIKTSGENRST